MNEFDLQFCECPLAVARLNGDLEIVNANTALYELLALPSETQLNAGLLNCSLASLFESADQASITLATATLPDDANPTIKLATKKLANINSWVRLHILADAANPDKTKKTFLAYFVDVTQSHHTKQLIESLSMDLNLTTGDSFFVNVCRFITEKLGYAYAFVCQSVDNNHSRMIAGIGEGKILDNFEYSLLDTPCYNVVGKKVCIYPSSVQLLFPKDVMLQQLGVESYLGSPLFDSKGMALGHIVILGKQSLSSVNAKLAEATISIFSGRVAAELERVNNEHLLAYQASHDSLCDIFNRRAFQTKVSELIDDAKQDNAQHYLHYIDLDQFKVINDTAGHKAGDELLKQIAQLLNGVIGEDAVLGRLGGDEFGILQKNCTLQDAHLLANKLLQSARDYQFAWSGHVFNTGMSIGIVKISALTADQEELFKHADAACYLAKDHGRNSYHYYQEDDAEINLRESQLMWVSDLTASLKTDAFTLYAQAIISTDNDQAEQDHYEILIRKIDKLGNIVMPSVFLAAAERYNLISQIDVWVINQCFKLLSEHPTFLNKINFISINLSGQSVTSAAVRTLIKNQLANYNIPGSKLCFEITETAAIENLSEARQFIGELRSLGCRFALDDFGTGLSSLSYLKNLPVDYLKIDGLFVKDIVDDPIDRAMVHAMNEMGQIMGMQTIAEFVENDSIKTILKDVGVDYMQGYGISKPNPISQYLH